MSLQRSTAPRNLIAMRGVPGGGRNNSLWRPARSPCYGLATAPQDKHKSELIQGGMHMLQGKWLTAFSGVILAVAFGGSSIAADTIKVAYTDPLSGPFAQVGDANLKQMQYII